MVDRRSDRWRFTAARRVLRPANRPSLDRWVGAEGSRLHGLVLNVGCGSDTRRFGRRTIRLDRYAPAIDVRADLGTPLPFASGTFAGAVCSEVLEHVADPGLVVREIRRVLAPGARALFTVPFVFHYHQDPEDYRRYSPDGLRRELEHAGFVIEMVAGCGGKIVAAALLAEAVHPMMKLAVRLALAPFAPVLSRHGPVPGRSSDWAANVVAIATVPS